MIKLGLLKCPERIVHINRDKACLINRHTYSRSRCDQNTVHLGSIHLAILCFIIQNVLKRGPWRKCLENCFLPAAMHLIPMPIKRVCLCHNDNQDGGFMPFIGGCTLENKAFVTLLWAQNQVYWCYTGTYLNWWPLLCLTRCKGTIVIELMSLAFILATRRCHLLKATKQKCRVHCLTTYAHNSIGWLYNSLFKSNFAVLAGGPSRIDTRKINLWIFGERQRTAAT